MIVDYKYRKHFSDYALSVMNERDIRPWYVAYYGEMRDSIFRSCLKSARLPKPISLIMIAELFECTVNELLGFELVDVETRDRLFDSGRDTKHVLRHFKEQLKKLIDVVGLDPNEQVVVFNYDIFPIEAYIEFEFLPDTPILLRICEMLDCTPSELLGY